jgi:hypothetical protein
LAYVQHPVKFGQEDWEHSKRCGILGLLHLDKNVTKASIDQALLPDHCSHKTTPAQSRNTDLVFHDNLFSLLLKYIKLLSGWEGSAIKKALCFLALGDI